MTHHVHPGVVETEEINRKAEHWARYVSKRSEGAFK